MHHQVDINSCLEEKQFFSIQGFKKPDSVAGMITTAGIKLQTTNKQL